MPSVCVFAPVTYLDIALEAHDERGRTLHLKPGGQGYWVARIAALLGAETTLCTPLGGETGDVLRSLMKKEDCCVHEISMTSDCPWNIELHHPDRTEMIAQAQPHALSRDELDELYSVALAEAIAADVSVLAGAHLQPVMPDDTYTRLAHDLRQTGNKVVVDLSGDPLLAALAGGVDVLKMSDEELVDGRWVERDAAEHELWHAVDRLNTLGASSVVISRVGQPSLALWEGLRYSIEAPHLHAVGPKGSGDALTAALAVGLALDAPVERLLQTALATAGANVTRHATASGHRDTIDQLATKVIVCPG